MDAELKSKWVKALRSGEYKQYRGALCLDGALCCIGVGAVVAKPGFKPDNFSLTHDAAEFFGLADEHIDLLVAMNDEDEKSFAEIADYIEANL